MNYLKTDVAGVDVVIKKLQTYIYDNLVEMLGVTSLDAYGRVYKNIKKDLIVPEYYASSKEYREVLLDDNKDAIMFFSPNDTSNIYGSLSVQECDLIFSVDLTSISGDNERKDEELRQQVLFLINRYNNNVKAIRVETGLQNVYSDYPGVFSYFLDMQEFHHFKITLELRYTNTSCK